MADTQKQAAFNPAAQVLEVLTRLKDAEAKFKNTYGRNFVDPRRTWCEALSVENNIRSLVTAIVTFGGVVDQVDERMKENTELYAALELGPTFKKIEVLIDKHLQGLSGLLVEAENQYLEVAQVGKLLKEHDWRSLKICDQFMRHGMGDPMTHAEVDGFLQVAESVKADAMDEADLKDGFRTFMVSNLAQIQDRLREVPTSGTEPVRHVVEHTIATAALNVEFREQMHSTSIGRRFAVVIAAIGLAVTGGVSEVVTEALLQSEMVSEVVRAITGS